MAKTSYKPLPSLQKRMLTVGENIHIARLRRRFSAALLAERAGITPTTLRAIERGEGTVSFGAYASVLFCLGLENDLELLARDDVFGKKLQDIGLTVKKRAPKRQANPKSSPGKSDTQESSS